MSSIVYFRILIIAGIILFSTQNIFGQIKEDAEIRYGNQSFKLVTPTKTNKRAWEEVKVFYLKDIGIQISISYEHPKGNQDILLRKVYIESPLKLEKNLTVRLPLNVSAIKTVSFPNKNGTLNTNKFTGSFKVSYHCAGVNYDYLNQLAFPMLSFSNAAIKYIVAADPYFSTSFNSNFIEWTYPKEIGLSDSVETRSVYNVKYKGNFNEAINLYYKHILNDVPPGPEWIHKVAMINYDYMSDSGKGWYRDIDSLNANIPPIEREKVCLALHGWYDMVGRYCYNDSTNKLDSSWQSFAPGVGVLTLDDIHKRIAYARSSGYRVVLYFADGILSGTKVPSYTKEKVMEGSGWSGADIIGKTFRQNPAHPEVYRFYINYTKALAKEFGAVVDGFVWDETFYITAGNSGSEYFPGYVDRTFMRLVKECCSIVHKVNKNAAFLTSDVIGSDSLWGINFSKVPPYALVSDGTLMDSNCRPDYWSYNIFSNYRNTVWSCNWYPETKFNLAEFGVKNYQAAVPLSNGYGDDKGFSELSFTVKNNYINLFRERAKYKTRIKYFSRLPKLISK